MQDGSIEIRPLAGSLGAEVHGLDLAAGLDREDFATVERAFLDHLVLFFRDQEITPAQQVAFAGRFGPIGRYPLAEPLPEHPDVIATHLVCRKITYVHRRLWPELFGVATSKETWQLDGLSRDCRTVFRRVEKHGFIRSDDEALLPTVNSRERRAVIRELEERLLVHCIEVHTQRGTHAKAMQTWARCRRQKQFRRKALAPSDARERLTTVVKLWSGGSNKNALLPWPLES